MKIRVERNLLVELLIDADALKRARQGRLQVGILHAEGRLRRRRLPRLRNGGKRRKRAQQSQRSCLAHGTALLPAAGSNRVTSVDCHSHFPLPAARRAACIFGPKPLSVGTLTPSAVGGAAARTGNPLLDQQIHGLRDGNPHHALWLVHPAIAVQAPGLRRRELAFKSRIGVSCNAAAGRRLRRDPRLVGCRRLRCALK